MTDHRVVSRDEWLSARRELLHEEKELTRRMDALAGQRRALPWTRVEKEYAFETEDGTRTLVELFGGRSQLIVYHFMFGPDWDEGCPSCSNVADGFDGFVVHLLNHDVGFTCVSRAPLDKLLAYKERMGWSFPWASSLGSEFNLDFGVSFTDEQRANGVTYNFRSLPADPGTDELPGMSAFAREGDDVFRTYSAYARGIDGLWGTYQWLDRTPKGRNEPDGQAWLRRRDQYEPATA